MNRTRRRLALGALFGLAALSVGPRAAAAADDIARMTMEERVAQVIFNTSKMSRAAGSPGAGATERYALPGEEGGRRVWGYRANVEEPDRSQIAWNFQVRLLPPGYAPDPAVEAQWTPYSIGPDTVTGGDTFFREATQNRLRRTRTYYRLTRGETQVLMTVTREGPETSAQAAEKAANRWRFFVGEAERFGLFDLVRLDVTLLPSATQGAESEPLRSAEVIQLFQSHRTALDVPLGVRARAPEIRADSPYVLKVKMKDALGRPGVSLRSTTGALTRGADGWMELRVPRGDTPASLSIRFDPYDLGRGQDLRGRVLDQVAQLRIEYRAPGSAEGRSGALLRDENPSSGEVVRARMDLAVQRGDWWPIVTRMELEAARQGGGGALPPSAPSAAAPSTDWGAIPEPLRNRFNAARVTGGDLREAWDRLLPSARSRPGAGEPGASPETPVFRPEEPVLLGWRLDRSTASDFLTAEVAGDRPNLQGSQVDVPLGWVIDVQIVTPAKLPSGEFDFPEMPGDAAGASPAEPIEDAQRAEAEFRRLVNVESLSLTSRRVALHGYGVAAGGRSGAAPEGAGYDLAKYVRMPAGFLPMTAKGPTEVVLMKEAFGRRRLDDYFPLESRGTSLGERGPDQSTVAGWRNEGIYELRLRMSLSYRVPDDHKEVDVAVRYNVVPVGFNVTGLMWESRRLANPR